VAVLPPPPAGTMGRPAQLQNQKPLQPCAWVLDESQFLIMLGFRGLNSFWLQPAQ
jgi:hypothetical protein